MYDTTESNSSRIIGQGIAGDAKSTKNVFHAGDGNLHPLILYNGREPGALHRAEMLAGEILQMCVDFGGSITGEHGIGLEKRAYLPRMYNEVDIETMRKVRLAIDPQEISNRGKVFSGVDTMPAKFSSPQSLEKAGINSRN